MIISLIIQGSILPPEGSDNQVLTPLTIDTDMLCEWNGCRRFVSNKKTALTKSSSSSSTSFIGKHNFHEKSRSAHEYWQSQVKELVQPSSTISKSDNKSKQDRNVLLRRLYTTQCNAKQCLDLADALYDRATLNDLSVNKRDNIREIMPGFFVKFSEDNKDSILLTDSSRVSTVLICGDSVEEIQKSLESDDAVVQQGGFNKKNMQIAVKHLEKLVLAQLDLGKSVIIEGATKSLELICGVAWLLVRYWGLSRSDALSFVEAQLGVKLEEMNKQRIVELLDILSSEHLKEDRSNSTTESSLDHNTGSSTWSMICLFRELRRLLSPSREFDCYSRIVDYMKHSPFTNPWLVENNNSGTSSCTTTSLSSSSETTTDCRLHNKTAFSTEAQQILFRTLGLQVSVKNPAFLSKSHSMYAWINLIFSALEEEVQLHQQNQLNTDSEGSTRSNSSENVLKTTTENRKGYKSPPRLVRAKSTLALEEKLDGDNSPSLISRHASPAMLYRDNMPCLSLHTTPGIQNSDSKTKEDLQNASDLKSLFGIRRNGFIEYGINLQNCKIDTESILRELADVESPLPNLLWVCLGENCTMMSDNSLPTSVSMEHINYSLVGTLSSDEVFVKISSSSSQKKSSGVEKESWLQYSGDGDAVSAIEVSDLPKRKSYTLLLFSQSKFTANIVVKDENASVEVQSAIGDDQINIDEALESRRKTQSMPVTSLSKKLSIAPAQQTSSSDTNTIEVILIHETNMFRRRDLQVENAYTTHTIRIEPDEKVETLKSRFAKLYTNLLPSIPQQEEQQQPTNPTSSAIAKSKSNSTLDDKVTEDGSDKFLFINCGDKLEFMWADETIGSYFQPNVKNFVLVRFHPLADRLPASIRHYNCLPILYSLRPLCVRFMDTFFGSNALRFGGIWIVDTTQNFHGHFSLLAKKLRNQPNNKFSLKNEPQNGCYNIYLQPQENNVNVSNNLNFNQIRSWEELFSQESSDFPQVPIVVVQFVPFGINRCGGATGDPRETSISNNVRHNMIGNIKKASYPTWWMSPGMEKEGDIWPEVVVLKSFVQSFILAVVC